LRDPAGRGLWNLPLIPLIAALVLAANALLLGNWFVDDAGISMVYARNLANGYGLTAQPGVTPVEGYSNFAFVLLVLTPLYLLHVMNPIVLKTIAVLLDAGAFLLLYRAARSTSRSPGEPGPWILVALLLLAIQPGFVIWSISGLENPLYALLLAGQIFLTLAAIEASNEEATVTRLRRAVLAGVIAALTAMTRPDGILFASGLPIALFGMAILRKRPWRITLAAVATYLAALAVVLGIFLAFRLSYYHSLVPNTYYAKGGPSSTILVGALLLDAGTYNHLLELGTALTGLSSPWPLLLVLLLWVNSLHFTRFRKQVHVFFLFFVLGTVDYLLLPQDWMGEYRFATPFFVFFYPTLALLLFQFVSEKSSSFKNAVVSYSVVRLTGITAVAIAIILVSLDSYNRLIRFAHRPQYPLSGVAEAFGTRFDQCAELLGIKNASVAAADMGGLLLNTHLRVYDVGMLCDATIARTLNKDHDAFYDYLLNQARPTFVHVHTPWDEFSHLSVGLQASPDYILVRHYQRNGFNWYDFVRKDALAGRTELLPKLREILGDVDLHRRALTMD